MKLLNTEVLNELPENIEVQLFIGVRHTRLTYIKWYRTLNTNVDWYSKAELKYTAENFPELDMKKACNDADKLVNEYIQVKYN